MDKSQPKYLNSPETPIFNKRRVLYNYNYARDLGYEAKRLIICEGYMDVIAMDRYGVGYAVAPLGTALTEEQIQEAWKVVSEPICCFDGDAAGIRAAIRSVDRVLPLLKPGYSLQYAFLPDKMDPDEFLKAKGKDEFIKTVTATVPLKDLLWRKTLEGKSVATPEQKALIEKEIKAEIALIKDETVKAYYVREMKDKVYANLAGRKTENNLQKTYQAPKINKELMIEAVRTDLDDLVAKCVISAFMCYPKLIEEFEEKLLSFTIKNITLKDLYEKMQSFVRENPDIKNEQQMEKALDKAFNNDGWRKMVDTRILRKQCPDIVKMREMLGERILEVQLKQLDSDIRDIKTKLENGSFKAEDFERYESLKKERYALLNESSEI